MDRITKIVVPKYLYDFYARTASQIRGYTPEMMMAEALRLYAGMICKPIADQEEDPSVSSSKSRSR